MATEAPVLTGTTPNGGVATESEIASPSLSEETLDTSVAEPTADTAEPEAAIEPGTGEPANEDGRLLPQHIRALKESNPNLFKAEKARFFEHRAYKEVFATPQEASSARGLLDQIGGEDGWNESLELQEQQRKFSQEYSSTDPEVKRGFVKGLFKDDPYSARAIVPTFLEEFRSQAPQDYTRLMSRVISNTFNAAFDNLGIKRVLGQIAQKFTAANQQIPEELAALQQWIGRFDELANSHSGVDEERERFEQEKREWQKSKQGEEAQALTTSYHNDVRGESQRVVKRHLSQILKENLPDAESMKDLVEHVEQRIASMAAKDQNYLRQRNQVLARKDLERAKKIVLAKINQLLPEAAKRELRLFNYGIKPKPKAQQTTTAATTAPKAGVVQVAKQPQSSEIDWRRSSGMVMRGEAILKDGRHVRWE